MNETVSELINQLRLLQDEFREKTGVPDIYSNSKIYELIIANALGHTLLPGHAGLRDAKDENKKEYEYKHYKESSCNHTWTFNDFSNNTINALYKVEAVIFVHIDDSGNIPVFDWYYRVTGRKIGKHLKKNTPAIKNTRKMINVSPKQLETLGIPRQAAPIGDGTYSDMITQIFSISQKLEELTGTKNVMTSNKIWEVMVSEILGHQVYTEQKKFDAKDKEGKNYEYKVSKTCSWNFEDISPKVLSKFDDLGGVILAVIDKTKLEVTKIYRADPTKVKRLLKQKLKSKKERFRKKGKEIRRLQVSISSGDLSKLGADIVFSKEETAR